jgi:perosamine synthetase
MIPWWTPVLGAREKALVAEVIDRNFPNDGEYTTRFEERIAGLLGIRYAVATTSGTAAIFLALAALGIGPGDEVIVPDLTFIATANAVKLSGATPVLVDVSRNDFNIDPERVESAINPRTRAIVPVHVSGRSANMTALLEIAARHSLHVVEDAAEALGSFVRTQALGTFGDAGCFSFSPNKTITTGQGGMVVTNNASTHRRLRELKDQGRPVRGTGGADEHISLGFNFKLTNVQAAIGLAQLEDFERRRQHLRKVYAAYRQVEDIPQLRLPGFNIETGECPQWVDALVEGRDSLHDFLLECGIETRKFWHPLHTQAPYASTPQGFENSTSSSRSGLWLPSALTLRDDDLAMVCDRIREWARTA